jgi:hypothetical protein
MGQFFSYRQLPIFSNKANAQLEQHQLGLLNKALAGVKERAIKISIIEKESSLFEKYNVDTTQYTVILIGKDGSEKYRTNKIIKIDQLFSIIDAMPMRKSEMNKSNKD